MATQAATKNIASSDVKAQETAVSAVDRAVGAAFIASGIGSLVLGLAIVITEMKAGAGIKAALAWNSGVGPLSGKTGVAIIAFVISWIGLHFAFKNRAVSLTTAFIVTVILLVIGLLLSFPPVFELFAN